ncbi:Uncharacterised protein [Mycobacteroides abscessus subsp. abscessus]|nr:Uncharacterised protein [Mycobacteroides abscessus subsp. abscessus]
MMLLSRTSPLTAVEPWPEAMGPELLPPTATAPSPMAVVSRLPNCRSPKLRSSSGPRLKLSTFPLGLITWLPLAIGL